MLKALFAQWKRVASAVQVNILTKYINNSSAGPEKPAFFVAWKIRIFVSLYPSMSKHEIIPCERCRTSFECKANAYLKCQCAAVQLDLNEVQYIGELYDGCLCAKCLFELQQEYKEQFVS